MGKFIPREELFSGRMIIAQVRIQQNKAKRQELACLILQGAAPKILKNLRYYNSRGKDPEPIITTTEQYAERISETTAIDELMGIEGNIRKLYYEGFELITTTFRWKAAVNGHQKTK